MVFDVYLAWDKIAERQVSLYVIKQYLAKDTAFAAGYAKGAEECSILDHPATLRFLEADTEDDEPYLIYEPVKGKSLAEILAGERKLSVVKASEIIVKVLQTLDRAHLAGLCHGDLTDDDILITEEGEVKVRGFGRRDGLAASAGAKETLDKYTVYFQSPELIQNNMPTELSDVYSCAVIYYRMLTGHMPFTGATSVEIASRILESTPGDIRGYNHEIPENIAELILKALNKEPEERVETASIFAQKITNCIKTGKPSGGFPEAKPTVEIEHPKEQSKTGGILNGFALIILVLFLSAAVTFFVASHGKTVVPDVVGLGESEAVSTLENAGFLVQRNDPTYSEEYKEGLIIFQKPEGGKKLKKGDTVTIQASRGNEFVVMPDVIGRDKSEAADIIFGAGLKVSKIKGEYSDTVPENCVISTNPEAALSVSKDTEVDMVISYGVDITKRFERREDENEGPDDRREETGSHTERGGEYSYSDDTPEPEPDDYDFDIKIE
ncbi:MAG: PASTA domain-containing protein [Abditibacteriota bacterium]|nr:PASTA domain-containing protein [Abditibacteriota bacterium]